jgi:predicted nucleic acid-binding protein
MKDNKPILVDTNILVYAHDTSNMDKHNIAKNLLASKLRSSKTLVISSQSLSEFFVVTTKKITNPLPASEVEKIISDIVNTSGWEKISYSSITVLRTIKMQIKYGKHYWDTLLTTTMLENGITTIYTENTKDFEKIPHIKAINPFA